MVPELIAPAATGLATLICQARVIISHYTCPFGRVGIMNDAVTVSW